MEIWDIIDEEGNKTGRTIVRGEKLQEGDYHLVVHVWIVNDKKEFLIQKRADHLKIMPGLWATTGGSATLGEDSKTAAIRETKEEVGINIDSSNMTKIRKVKKKDHLADVWLIKQNISPEEVILQKEEVSEAKWAGKDEIMAMVESGIFCDYGDEYFDNLFKLN